MKSIPRTAKTVGRASWHPHSALRTPHSALEDGVALVMTLILLSIITFMAIAALVISRNEKSSVATALDQSTARYAADAGRDRAIAEMVGRIKASNNAFNYDFFVSNTNLIRSAAAPGSPPPAPGTLFVPVTNSLGVPLYYRDENRNGVFDPGQDPLWLGLLEHPELPPSASNPFLARYCFMVLPAGKTLDINYIHNYLSGRSIMQSATGDQFLRDQGVGTYEINLAAGLMDLNPNVWSPSYAPYSYNMPGSMNTGAAFDDAYSLLRYRYAGSSQNLKRANQLFANNGAAFINDGVDLYPSTLMTLTALPTDPDNITKLGQPWPGSDNPNHFFYPQEFFDPAKTSSLFTNHLLTAIGNDPSTFTNFLRQFGTDSAPEPATRMHLNYSNIVNGSVVPGMVTNLGNWNPIDFFNNAAARLLADAKLVNADLTPLSLTNIEIYPVNCYTPAVHRLLQLAANIYDATTTNVFPSVFRPTFAPRVVGGTNRITYISGYQRVTTMADMLNVSKWHDVADSNIVPGDGSMVYGIPLVVGAKKRLPNFNAFGNQTTVEVVRRLQFSRVSTGGRYGNITSTNVQYTMTISNRCGVDLWNSYSTVPSIPNLYVIASGEVVAVVTNEFGDTIYNSGPQPIGGATSPLSSAVNPWYGYNFQQPQLSFKVPLLTNFLVMPNSVLWPPTGGFIAGFHVPHWWLQLTLRLRVALAEVGTGRLVDYVNLSSTTSSYDLTYALMGGQQINKARMRFPDNHPAYTDGQYRSLWVTNHCTSQPRDTPSELYPTYGIYNQILVSEGDSQIQDLEGGWNKSTLDPAYSSVDYARNYFLSQMGNKGGAGAAPVFYAGFTPLGLVYFNTSWQANDPLVHYTVPDLTDAMAPNTNSIQAQPDSPPVDPVAPIATRSINRHYRPWGAQPDTSPPTSQNWALRDVGVASSDGWDFPAGKFPNVGWLGRVHRGTPWQTVFLKSLPVDSGTWSLWTGYWGADGGLTQPTNDWRILDLFTTALNDNATRGRLSVNQTGLAAWSAALSGVSVLTNALNPVAPYGSTFIQPAGIYIATNPTPLLPPLVQIVNGINRTRSTRSNGSFQRVGDILAVPELTVASPFINSSMPVICPMDEIYERIPQQIMGLLQCDSIPRVVIYTYAQALKPQHKTPGGVIDNYQVTAEVATRSVVRIDGAPANCSPVIESFTVLPPD